MKKVTRTLTPNGSDQETKRLKVNNDVNDINDGIVVEDVSLVLDTPLMMPPLNKVHSGTADLEPAIKLL